MDGKYAAILAGLGVTAVAAIYFGVRGGGDSQHPQQEAKEEEEEEVSSTPPPELELSVFQYACSQLQKNVNVERTIILLKKSSGTDDVRKIIVSGCLDALLPHVRDHSESVLFVLANASSDPKSHPFFFSGRFSLLELLPYEAGRGGETTSK
jgi:hypothetical protein